ncbi:MAG: hypothetical protein R2874_08015 [Desulfobacterales bacterium]
MADFADPFHVLDSERFALKQNPAGFKQELIVIHMDTAYPFMGNTFSLKILLNMMLVE